jgi:K+-sensing histidine kinase KdpD
MKKIVLLVVILFSFQSFSTAQGITPNKKSIVEAVWDQGIPVCPDDKYISSLIDKVGFDNLRNNKKPIDKNEAKLCREIGIAFYNRGMYEAADWYLERVRGYVEVVELEPEVVFETPKQEEEEEDVSIDDIKSLEADKEFLQNLPKSYDNVSPGDMKKLADQIEDQIKKLIAEKEALLKRNAPKSVIDAKDAAIGSLGKEKEIIDLSIEKEDLEVEVVDLEDDKKVLRKYLIGSVIGIIIAILAIIALLQRKTIRVKDVELEKQLDDINKKNTYLEYAARIIRHDMHSGINTYMPRGLSSLQKRMDQEKIDELKIGPSLKMISEGLAHTQKVYKNVYEFTNLVKVKADFSTKEIDLKEALEKYLANTSYRNQVVIDDLGLVNANEQLFCNAIDNLIKNGLKYNEKNDKCVKIYKEVDVIVVEDNGIGLTSKKFEELIKKGIDTESDTGIGLSITKAIIEEHGYSIFCEKVENGTKMKIKI